MTATFNNVPKADAKPLSEIVSTAGRRWAAAWSQEDVNVWLSVYADEATYSGYAFGFIRRGKEGLDDHFKLWRHANPDFKMNIVEQWPPIDLGDFVKCSIRTENIGTWKNDLRVFKASGKKFNFYAVVDLVVRKQDGLITKVEEWYHRQFDIDGLIERDSN